MVDERNIYINGRYLANNPTWGSEDSEWKAAEIHKLLKRNNIKPSSIADVGCGFGHVLLHLARLSESPAIMHGFDISPQAIEVARRSQNETLEFYLLDFAEDVVPRQYDLILVIDVIEHLGDYGRFLKKIKSKGEKFVFHIPLDLSCRTLLKPHIILQQRSDVGHLHYFTKEHVEWALKDAGFRIIDWLYTYPELDRLPARTLKTMVKKVLRKLSYALRRDLSVKLWGGYSIMILATPNE